MLLTTHKLSSFITLGIALFISFSSTVAADTIELKDGKKIECVLVMKGPERYAVKTWKLGLCEIEIATIEEKDVASFKENTIGANDKLIRFWKKKIWDSCPEVKKQEELRKMRARENRERRATERRKREKELERETKKENYEASEIKGASKYVGNDIYVINENDFDWENVKLDLNPGLIFSGYICQAGTIGTGETHIISMSEFIESDGTRFNIFKTKPVELSIYADTPSGRNVGTIKFK